MAGEAAEPLFLDGPVDFSWFQWEWKAKQGVEPPENYEKSSFSGDQRDWKAKQGVCAPKTSGKMGAILFFRSSKI